MRSAPRREGLRSAEAVASRCPVRLRCAPIITQARWGAKTVCSYSVIASAAKQSRVPQRKDPGLLRCARNDGGGTLPHLVIPLCGKRVLIAHLHRPARLLRCRACGMIAATPITKPPSEYGAIREAFFDEACCVGYFCCCVGAECKRRTGPGQAATEDRRHPRHVEPVCRHHRPRQRDRGQDGRGGFWR